MIKRLFSVVISAFCFMPMFAQKANTDSIKAEMDKIELTNPAMQQLIDRYKKGVIKGDVESIHLLGMECLSGKNVKYDMEMGLNLLDNAAKQEYVPSQYSLGSYFFRFWAQKPTTDAFFTSGSKWFKKAIRNGDNASIIALASFTYEYGRYKQQETYIDAGIKLLETYPKVADVNNKDDQVLKAQALIGTMNLGKWRLYNDTTSLRDAKKWYRTLLKSQLEFPAFTDYIDSLQAVLSMGVPMRLDPMPTEQEIEESKQAPSGFGGGRFPGGGFPGGGRPGGAQPAGPALPQAIFPGGVMKMQSFISNNTYYPENLQKQKVTGRVTVSFTVDTDGAVINPSVTTGSDVFIMDKEALRTIMVMPDWIPAQENGVEVQAQHSATVNFGSANGMGGFGGGFGF